ncbi:uncharacterized protein LOC111319023 [Stylophora pistillata]|uniref:uncharacterized protein LOC111319023 n=1 Tax=Stylophora pistillata TaxID=50429 RepID=UPI000C03AE3E|nr:uncharacterized protein LOC111319023 [Stylophora pistillata]
MPEMKYLTSLSVALATMTCFAIGCPQSSCGTFETHQYVFKIGQYDCECEPLRAGQMTFEEGIVYVCDGSEWRALQYEAPLGSRSDPGFSCKDIKAHLKGATNGIYWITLTDSKDSFQVYCDMDAGGWTMVFKAVSGINKKVYPTYNSPHTSSEKVMAALDVTNNHKDHYKNRIVLNWAYFHASEARVVPYTGGNIVKEVKFNAKGSDKLNWFSAPRLIDSSWKDMKSQPKNVISIPGRHNRNFFINRQYGGCPNDAGWMAITGHFCEWEKRFNPRQNVIIYSKLQGIH